MTKPKGVPYITLWRRSVLASDLPSGAKATALTYGEFMNGSGENAFPGIARVAAACNLSDSTVKDYRRLLIREGWLVITTPGGGRGHPTVYCARIPEGCDRSHRFTGERVRASAPNGATTPRETVRDERTRSRDELDTKSRAVEGNGLLPWDDRVDHRGGIAAARQALLQGDAQDKHHDQGAHP